jgi:uncharacterized cupredoxin-like copper-binding protein
MSRRFLRLLAAIGLASTAAAAWAGAGIEFVQHQHAHSHDEDATAFGRVGKPGKATRTIRIQMADTMRFTPAHIVVKRGETVRLVATNRGAVLHELVLGTPDDLSRHAEMMRKWPGMAHDEAHMVHVRPGKTGQIVWQFTEPGEFQFACLIPGHFEAGMVGRVTVE